MIAVEGHLLIITLLLTAGILAGIDVALARGRTWLGWAMVFVVVALLLSMHLEV
jgi:hypothetical protein